MNLKLLKKSNTLPKKGDLFRLQFEDEREFYGKVLAENVDPTFMRIQRSESERVKLWAVAIYRPSELPEDKFAEFLIEPQVVNRQGWLKGYFETVGHSELSTYDIENSRYWVELSQLYYEINWDTLTGRKVDKPDVKWIGDLGVGNHLTIADWIGGALGQLG